MTRLRHLRTGPASLRGRVVLGTLALLTMLLAGLFVTVDVILTARLHADLRTRLTDRAALARQLDGALSAQDLVDRLRGDGVAALLCSSSSTSTASGSSTSNGSGGLRCVQADSGPEPPGPRPTDQPGGQGGRGGSGRPSKPPAHKPGNPPSTGSDTTVQTSGPVLFLRTTLPSSGQVLTLSVDSSQVGSTLRGLILLEVIGGVVALLLATLLAFRVVGLALRPLDHMTGLARRIAAGDRGRRLGTGRDDTELGRTGAAFDDMLDELESALTAAAAAETRLRGFLSDVSHELRTPLTGLVATTETLLRDEPPDRATREHLYVTLVRETRRANRLVDDLLTMTRLDTGISLAPESFEPVDLVDVAGHEVDRLRLLSPDLRISTSGAEHAPVRGDATRLGQVVANVLGNARTAAGPGGEVSIDVRADGECWVLDVADSGSGVPSADVQRIFERLVRLDASRSRERGGFGLGLPIARALARAHGGDLVCVPDPPGGGALFRLTLPRTSSVAGAGQ